MGYTRRTIDAELDELLESLPAIAIEGAKAVGKTETASRRAASRFDLDEPAGRAVAEADPGRVLSEEPPVLIDEWQLLPSLWDGVRRAVDGGADPGSFLLTGSSSGLDRGSHSGGGRIVSLRMRPMSLAERWGKTSVKLSGLLQGAHGPIRGETTKGLDDYVDEIVRSGYPGLRHLDQRPLELQLDSYLERVVDRDFAELGSPLRNPAGLRRWMRAYASAVSTSTSFEKIRNASTAGQHDKPAKTTVQPYRDVLERLFILDEVDAWLPSRSSIARLAQPPKHHLADPALAARLLGITRSGLLGGSEPSPFPTRHEGMLGQLFESLVTLSIKTYAQAVRCRVYHLRTHGGSHEVDLIVEREDGRVLAIEVKLAEVPRDDAHRHLDWLKETIGDDLIDRVIISTGKNAYRRPDGVAVVPAALLGP